MNRKTFLGSLCAIATLAVLGEEIIGTDYKKPPIHPDQIIDIESWLRNELARRYAEAIDRQILFGNII